MDIQQPGDDLRGYRLVVAPHLHILTPEIVKNLVAYVRGGGHLLLGPRSGFKDEHNALLPSRQPGKEPAALLGAHVAEFYALKEPVPVGKGTARIWAEYLVVDHQETEVLLRYGKSNGWLDDNSMAQVLKVKPLPSGIEVSRRGPVQIIINLGKQTRSVKIDGKVLRMRGGDVQITRTAAGRRNKVAKPIP